MKFSSRWLGQIDFDSALSLQMSAHDEVAQKGEGLFLGLEHPPVITLGIRGRLDVDVLVSEEERAALGLNLSRIDRGGQATLHSPGQLVIYPILPLRSWQMGARKHVELLQNATALLLSERGIDSHVLCEAPGVHTKNGKIASIGIRVLKGVTLHGLAINVHNDLKLFRSIRPCGAQRAKIDRMADYGERREVSDLFTVWVGHWKSLAIEKCESIDPVENCGD